MKTLRFSLYISLLWLTILSCTKEDDYEIPPVKQTVFKEDFSDSTNGTDLNTSGWVNISQQGTKKWKEGVFNDNGYAEFTSFNSAQLLNIAWLISPEINMDLQQGEKLFFQTAHNFLTSRDNTIELMVSKDFDGVNFAASSWTKIDATMVNPDIPRFTWVKSGEIDFSQLSGKIRFAFKVTGSGTNTNLDGTFQLDNIRLYTTPTK